MAKKKIQDLIAEWMQPFGRANGFELSRCEFVKEGSDWYLRVFVDRYSLGVYGYMSSGDCDFVSKFLSEKLDEEDPIPQKYYLEVSSPGLDRPLISEKDFIRFTGELIEIKLYEAIDGKKELSGILKSFKDNIIAIELEDGKVFEISKDKTAKVNLAVVF